MKHSTAKRIGALLLAVLLLFAFAACTKPAAPAPSGPDEPDPVTEPENGGDKPAPAGPGEPEKEPEPLAGEKEGGIPVALQLTRKTVAHEEWFSPDEYGPGMLNCRMMTAYEALAPVDGATFSKLAAALDGYFARKDALMTDNLEEMQWFRENLSKEELTAYVPVGFAAVDGMYLHFLTTVHRADTRVVSFTEELYANVGEDARSFLAKTVDTQTGAFLALDDVLDNKTGAMAFIGSEVKRLFGDVELPDEIAFTVDWQGLTLYFDYPELDFLAETPTLFLSFAEHPDFVKAYFRDVPDAYAVPYEAVAEHGFDTDGDGTLERITTPGEWGENRLLYKNGRTWLLHFCNSYNPWESLMDSETDWECTLYEYTEAGPDYLWVYPGKPYGNELTDPDSFRLQTRIELSDDPKEGADPYEPVTLHVALTDDGNLADAETGTVWRPELPDVDPDSVRATGLFGSWSTSFIAGEDGGEIRIRLEFYENGYLIYSYDKGDGYPIETYTGRYRVTHNVPGAQYGGGLTSFTLICNGGSAYSGDPHEFWSMNTITYPEYDSWDTIRIRSEGDLLGRSFGNGGGGNGEYIFYRTFE